MKNFLYAVLLISMPSFHLFGQEWNLVVQNGKYNYSISGQNVVSSTIQVVNAAQVGADSMFWVTPKKLVTFFSSPYVGLVGNVLGDSILKKANGVYECRFRPITDFSYPVQPTQTIKTRASVGDSWTFMPGVTATVTAQIDTVCWGIADSIKTISLSNGQSIRLSKQFGVFQIEEKTLIGLEAKNIGLQLPKREDFYSDWVSGAIFETTSSSSTNFQLTSESWNKYYVEGKSVSGDTILIQVHMLEKRKTYYNGTLDTTTYADLHTVVKILNRNQVSYPGAERQNFQYVSTGYSNTAEGLKLSIGPIITPSGTSFAQRYEYIIGLGNTYYSLSASSGWDSYEGNTVQKGYKKAGQAVHGTIHPDSFFWVVSKTTETHADLEDFTVFPNPVQGETFNLLCDSCPKVESLEILDISGKRQIAVSEPNFANPVSTAGLPKGLYVVRLQSHNNQVAVKKLLIQ